MAADIGFIIEYVVSDTGNHFHAIGRCGEFPIQVGDEFHKVYAPSVVLRNTYQGLGESSQVNLRVERIQAYQHQLPKLGQGMTGTIDLCGEGLNKVIPGAVLAIPARREGTEHEASMAIQHGNQVS